MSLVEKVAARIKQYRERRGMTQEALAAKVGITRGYLARVETAWHDLPLSTLERLAKALRVKVGKLLE